MITFSDGMSLFKVTAMVLVLPFAASADMISNEAKAHIACYAALDLIFEGSDPPYTVHPYSDALAHQMLEHERKYIEVGLDDLKNRQDTWVRNGLLYRLGKYAQYLEEVQKARIYCDDPRVYECAPVELEWRTVEQIVAAAFRTYQRNNCELLLK
jgi:hypothetical protein